MTASVSTVATAYRTATGTVSWTAYECVCVCSMWKNDVSNEHTMNCFLSHSLTHLPAYSSIWAMPIVLVHFVVDVVVGVCTTHFFFIFNQQCVECSHDCTTRALHSLWNDKATRIRIRVWLFFSNLDRVVGCVGRLCLFVCAHLKYSTFTFSFFCLSPSLAEYPIQSRSNPIFVFIMH